MKRFLKILLPILLVLLLAALGGFLLAQRDNLKALQNSLQYTTQELEDQLAENHQAVQDAVAQLPNLTVRDLTDEEKEALHSGTINNEKLVEALTKPIDKPDVVEKPPEPTKEELYQQALAAEIAKVYILQETFTGALGQLEREAKDAYNAMTASQRTKSKLIPFAKEYIAKATALENQCDDQMDSIVAAMLRIKDEYQGDRSIIDTVIETYANEKSLKKAWYMSKLKEKGLV